MPASHYIKYLKDQIEELKYENSNLVSEIDQWNEYIADTKKRIETNNEILHELEAVVAAHNNSK